MSISRLLEIVRLLCRSVFSTYWVLQNTLSTSMQCWTLPYLQARVCPAPAWAWQGAWPRRRSLAWASSPWWPRWAPCRCPAPRGPSSSSRTQPAPQVGKGHFKSPSYPGHFNFAAFVQEEGWPPWPCCPRLLCSPGMAPIILLLHLHKCQNCTVTAIFLLLHRYHHSTMAMVQELLKYS